MARKTRTGGTGDYEIGRGKPPKHSRFQKGQSGNPGGRKQSVRNLSTVVNAVMTGEVTVTENGRTRKVPVVEAILLRQIQDALRGQHRVAEHLLDRFERAAREAEGAGAEPELTEDDHVLLGRAFGRARTVGASAPCPTHADEADEAGEADHLGSDDPEADAGDDAEWRDD